MKRLIILSLLCFCVLNSYAQKENNVVVVAGAVNSITYRPVIDAMAYLLTPDSVVVDSMKTFESELDDNTPIGTVYFQHAIEGESYILCIKHYQYKTVYLPFVARLKKNEQYCIVEKKIRMNLRPMERQLAETVVKATKIKFYLKGDTLVYNADAFQLEHGSMLDALIRQMPGVQLRDDGEITVNGRKVDELLLNGKEFFDHNRQIMLDNLPAYMVKNVKAYEKESDRDKFFGKDIDGQRSYVMDIGLKRQYSIGYIGNAEVAGGTENRYLARMFALRFSPQSRLSVYALMNNLNDSRRPGQNGDWSPAEVGSGLVSTRKGALDYNVDDKKGDYRLHGGIEMSYQDQDNRSFSNSTSFLKGGDIYGLSRNSSRGFNTSLYTEHNLSWQKGVYLSFSPTFAYSNIRNRSIALASSLEKTYKNGQEMLDSIFLPQSTELIKHILINRSRQMGINRSWNYNSGGSLSFNFKPCGGMYSMLNISGGYQREKNRTFNLQKVDFPQTDRTGIYRDQYYSTPVSSYNFSIAYGNAIDITKYISVTPTYQYVQNYSSANRVFFSFEEIGGEKIMPFGALPSTTDSLVMARNIKNSYISSRMNNRHEAGITVNFLRRDLETDRWDMRMDLPVSFSRNNIRYHRDSRQADISRHYAAFEPGLNIQHYRYIKDSLSKRTIQDDIRMSSKISAPDILYFVPWYSEESDPMNLFMNNTGLKNSRIYNVSYQRLFSDPRREVNWHWDINYSITSDALAIGQTVDRSTGIRTYRPVNLNGNWSVFGGAYYYTPLDKKHRWSFSTYTVANYSNNVDMSGDENSGSIRSDVHNLRLSEYLNASVKFRKMRLTAVFNTDWYNATSRREGFRKINAENFKYGLTCNYNMPWSIDFATDIMMYSRRGYEDNAMNTDDLVWNARISKGIMKDNIIFSLEGFDILRNLSSVSRSLNAQGRVETFSNVIPSYYMLHLTYRLNIKPKKRPGDE